MSQNLKKVSPDGNSEEGQDPHRAVKPVVVFVAVVTMKMMMMMMTIMTMMKW
jgi:hypothetical protein